MTEPRHFPGRPSGKVHQPDPEYLAPGATAYEAEKKAAYNRGVRRAMSTIHHISFGVAMLVLGFLIGLNLE